MGDVIELAAQDEWKPYPDVAPPSHEIVFWRRVKWHSPTAAPTQEFRGKTGDFDPAFNIADLYWRRSGP